MISQEVLILMGELSFLQYVLTGGFSSSLKDQLWPDGCLSHTFSVLLVMSPSPTGLGGYRFPNAPFMSATQVSLSSDDRVTIFPAPVCPALIYSLRLSGIRNDLKHRLGSWRSKKSERMHYAAAVHSSFFVLWLLYWVRVVSVGLSCATPPPCGQQGNHTTARVSH